MSDDEVNERTCENGMPVADPRLLHVCGTPDRIVVALRTFQVTCHDEDDAAKIARGAAAEALRLYLRGDHMFRGDVVRVDGRPQRVQRPDEEPPQRQPHGAPVPS